MNDPQLSVIIPAYNEEARIRSTLQQTVSYLEGRELSFEVLVVDDGSRDGTTEAARQLLEERGWQDRVRLLRGHRNRGKGHSVRRGMLGSRGHQALLTDADLSTPIEELEKLEAEMMKGRHDITFGSRDLADSRIERHQPWVRELGGKIFNRLVRLLTGMPFRDTQCGFKLFQMPRCRSLFERQTIEDFGFDVEILFMARKWDWSASEVPVRWRHQSGSKVRLLRHSVPMFIDLLQIRWNDWRGRYQRTPDGGS